MRSAAVGVLVVSLVCLLAACRTDLATTEDAGVTCDQLSAQLDELVSSHRSCESDEDCVYVNANCGLSYRCAAPIEKAFVEDATKIVNEWFDRECSLTSACMLCPKGATSRCDSGQCI